ncbi:MAG: DUF4139 domain-containing protein [Pseudomonadota bacterium]
MRTLSVVACFVLLLAAPAVARAADEDLTLKRAVLSTGGVGYFEYEATVDGDQTLRFDVRLDQVDDVLKSLVVFDGAGGVGSVSLPGRAGLADLFRDLPFDGAALQSPATLLRALTGSEVTIEGPSRISGRILSVVPEVTQLDDGTTITRHRLTVMGEDGLAQAILEDANEITFADAELEEQIADALADLAQHRVQDRRTLEVKVSGEGERLVRVGYVVEAPLWKTSYRLALGDDGKALLQGWAVLENMSGQDWEAVDLTLVSGNPVTFRQALYQAYYVARPEVPVDVAGQVLPPVDSGTVGGRARTEEAEADFGAAVYAAEEMMLESAVMADVAVPAPVEEPGYATLTAATSEDAATQVVFRVPQPVTVDRGQSLMVPLVDQDVDVAHVALYSPNVQARHPLAAVELTNNTAIGLPPGVVTIYEKSTVSGGETFVGDARLPALQAGDSRLIAYAVDQKTLIDRENDYTATISRATIDRGVLHVSHTQTQTTTYTIEAPVGEAREVILEHPRVFGWDLVSPSGDVEKTDTAYRIPVSVPAGQTVTMKVVMEQPQAESLNLLTMADPQVVYFAEDSEIPADVRDAFKRLAELKGAVGETERKIAETERERQVLLEEQERLRDNLDTVPRESDLHTRYMNKLGEQEDAIESLLLTMDDLRNELTARRKALTDYVKGLTI